ncbi:MAG: SUMF1/EgtB/PvdO family nonheme iron enzyme [Candidatus Cloacimonetes bacterium]|nr:SUMF1/EgtB/PvdO family nonheme iron enzyme [Candidatus Cloacimonadota bacterium]
MPFCKNCGANISETTKFCGKCGKPTSFYKTSSNQRGTVGSNDGSYGNRPILSVKTINGNEQGNYGSDVSDLPQSFNLENRYRIEQKLGRGGFGTVYKAWDNNIDKVKALKVLDNIFYDDKRVIADLKHEALLLLELNSRYVVRIWDIHLKGDIKFIDMEYIEGGDLEDLLLSFPEKKVPEKKVMELIEQISKGMFDIHNQRIVHKDLKPQNIMLTKSGNIKIMDFGISETFRSSKSRLRETSKSGTPIYMSPEQLLGKNVGKEADIWSFGIMMYELLSGKQMFTGSNSNEVYFQIEQRKYNPISGISPNLNRLLENCLQKNFRERFSGFDEILSALENPDTMNKPKNIFIQQPEINLKTRNYNESNANQSYIKKDITPPHNMVFVQGGTFQMGGEDFDDEKPIHSVTLDDFFIGKYPVTQKEWQDLMGNNPSSSKGDNKPVERVNWNNAIKFCNKKSIEEGLELCYSGEGQYSKCDFSKNGYRLPTEAEWEYAARGGIFRQSLTKNGTENYKYSGSNNIDEVAEYKGNNDKTTKPVGKKMPNELGIYDMSGNVWEWCNDRYDNSYYSISPKSNPQGHPLRGFNRVCRGGYWGSSTKLCRVADRGSCSPSNPYDGVGFRILRANIF